MSKSMKFYQDAEYKKSRDYFYQELEGYRSRIERYRTVTEEDMLGFCANFVNPITKPWRLKWLALRLAQEKFLFERVLNSRTRSPELRSYCKRWLARHRPLSIQFIASLAREK